jgi:serine protease Do
MRRFVTYGPAFVVLCTTLVVLLAAPAAIRRIGYARTDVSIRLAQAQLDGGNVLEQINRAVRSIAQAVEPTVVHIAVESEEDSGSWRQRFSRGTRLSQGSGWIYDTRGHVVTNAHVIRGAPRITVQFHDGRTSEAEAIGIDATTDIAVIRVKQTEGLFPARRATGEEPGQGDRVYAFGSPFGFKFSMSEGIVSGLGRDPRGVIGTTNGYTNFIQTDAAVNPGNSGGPLVDIHGRVVGMNVAIATGTQPSGTSEGQSSGISFAIPLETIESVVEQIIERGTVAKGYLGIRHPEDDDRNQRLLSRAEYEGKGVYLDAVPEGGPAAAAGLAPGDIIVEFDGRKISGVAGLRQAITVTRPGARVQVKAWRQGSILTFDVTLADQAESDVGIGTAGSALAAYGVNSIGRDEVGVTLGDIRQASGAHAAGLRAGYTILSIEGEEVTSERDLLRLLAENGFANGRKVSAVVADTDGRRRRMDLQLVP